MKNPPSIKAARITGPLTVEIDWSTGETLPVDLNTETAPPFDALRAPDFFARMDVPDWGDGLDWPGGLSLGADKLYSLCRQQAGLTTPGEFDAWMQRNALSLATAAEALGMTRRMVAHYRTGSRPIPKVVGLALRGLEHVHRSGRARKRSSANSN